MTNTIRGALPLVLALLVGLGAGAAWRAGGVVVKPQHAGHANRAGDMGGMGGMGGMDGMDGMGGMDMSDKADMAQPADQARYAIDLANEVCPIMGNEPEGDVYVHWEGLRVQLCCAFCEEGFLADPEGTLHEVGVDPTAALASIAELRAAEGAEREALLAELSSRFRLVVVEPGEE